MKKKAKSYTKKFIMPHLYREDLQEIESILKNGLQVRFFDIDVGDYEYESIDEISQEQEKTNYLRIRASDPGKDGLSWDDYEISFNSNRSDLWAHYKDELKSEGAVKKLSEIISKRERKFLWFSLKLLYYSAILGIFFFTGLFAWHDFKPQFSAEMLFAWLFSVFIMIFSSNYVDSASIEFVNKKERSNFWIRNKDKIFLIIIGFFLEKFFKFIVGIIYKM
ncbi:hypothetical protein M1316_00175 [Candidatus Parvarchaeota archaeon]|nr:hypothetical protein [Candidatus Parvarchaeota archaeon]